MLRFLLRVVLVSAVILPLGYVASFRVLTGHWLPIREVHALAQPVTVQGWTAEGLRLGDGRLLPLPGVSSLPKESAVLSEGIKRGVEIDGEGRVYGLVNVRRTCGNDPVIQRVVRVDLADLLVFLQEAKSSRPLSPGQMDWPQTVRRGFDEKGWSVGDLGNFTEWQYQGRLAAGSL